MLEFHASFLFTVLAFVSREMEDLPSGHSPNRLQFAVEVHTEAARGLVVESVALQIVATAVHATSLRDATFVQNLLAIPLCVICHTMQIRPVSIMEDSAFLCMYVGRFGCCGGGFACYNSGDRLGGGAGDDGTVSWDDIATCLCSYCLVAGCGHSGHFCFGTGFHLALLLLNSQTWAWLATVLWEQTGAHARL